MLIKRTERAEHDRRVNNMSIRKVVAGLLITAGIAIMAVPFFWRATGERNTDKLINQFEQTLEDDYDEETLHGFDGGGCCRFLLPEGSGRKP